MFPVGILFSLMSQLSSSFTPVSLPTSFVLAESGEDQTIGKVHREIQALFLAVHKKA